MSKSITESAIWKETLKFNRYISDTSEVYLKVNVMQKERQHWNMGFQYTYINSSRCYSLLVTAAQDRGYRYRANYCEIEISESTTVYGKQRINLNDLNYNKFQASIPVLNYPGGRHYIEISVTLGCAEIPKYKGITYNLLKTMLDNGVLTDFTIKTQCKVFPCHKLVLASSSPYFTTMFTTPMTESQNNALNWVNVFDEATVRDLLQYVYTRAKPAKISSTCFNLIQASHLCLLEELKEMCAAEIIATMTKDNVVALLAIGEKYESEDLKESALNFISEKYEELEGDPSKLVGWNALEPEMIKSVLMSIIKIIGRKNIRV